MIIYKYLSKERIDVLEKLVIRYTQPVLFNDPFDSKPIIINDLTKEQWRQIGEEELSDPKVADEFLAAGMDRGTVLSMASGGSDVSDVLLAFLGSFIGILSLSEVSDNIVMWSHYTGAHTGYILGFNADHEYFTSKMDAPNHTQLMRVNYVDTRPHIELSQTKPIDIYFTKSLQWAYEKEWRICKPILEAKKIIEGTPAPICLFEIPPECIKCVIIGCRAENRTIERINKALAASSHLSHVDQLHAYIDKDEYQLRFEKV